MKKHKKFHFNFLNMLCLLSGFLLFVTLYFLIRLDVLPIRYLLPIIFGIAMPSLLGIFFANRNKKKIKIIGMILLIISIAVNSLGIYYLYTTDSFFEKSFQKSISYSTTFYVVAHQENTLKKENLKGELFYYQGTNGIDKALSTLKKTYKVKGVPREDIDRMFRDLLHNKTNLMLVEKTSYDIVFDLDKELDQKQFKVLYTFDIKTKKESNTSFKDSFNIYIGGVDFTNNCMDFNLILSVNMKTHKILFTSIPRDYYIEVAGRDGRRDTLSYMGPYGIETSIKSLENFFGIKIDYYMKINTQSLVSIVDEVGGITYCSDIAFTTTHALVLNTYNDRGKKLYVKKGCQELNGIETLTVARERNAFVGRDRVRQANCRKIMFAIFEKLKSTKMIMHYESILTSLSSLYETTIPREVIARFVKDTMDGVAWENIEQLVDGEDGQDYVHLTSLKNWVTYPDMETVNRAKEKMKEVLG